MQILLIWLGVAGFLWLLWKLNMFLYERGFSSHRRTPKVEIQTLFHGNTKDEDQI